MCEMSDWMEYYSGVVHGPRHRQYIRPIKIKAA